MCFVLALNLKTTKFLKWVLFPSWGQDVNRSLLCRILSHPGRIHLEGLQAPWTNSWHITVLKKALLFGYCSRRYDAVSPALNVAPILLQPVVHWGVAVSCSPTVTRPRGDLALVSLQFYRHEASQRQNGRIYLSNNEVWFSFFLGGGGSWGGVRLSPLGT
jgi:hypothetical protein